VDEAGGRLRDDIAIRAVRPGHSLTRIGAAPSGSAVSPPENMQEQ
jgi:hypothetical protein